MFFSSKLRLKTYFLFTIKTVYILEKELFKIKTNNHPVWKKALVLLLVLVMFLGTMTPSFANIIINDGESNTVQEANSSNKTESNIIINNDDSKKEGEKKRAKSNIDAEEIADEKLRAEEAAKTKEPSVMSSDLTINEEVVEEKATNSSSANDEKSSSMAKPETVLYNGQYVQMVEPKKLTEKEFKDLQKGGQEAVREVEVKKSSVDKTNGGKESAPEISEKKGVADNKADQLEESKNTSSDIVINEPKKEEKKKVKSSILGGLLNIVMAAPVDKNTEDDTNIDMANRDGTKIESITSRWIDGSDDLKSEVWHDDEPKQMRFRTSFSLSGQYDYEIGTIQISIPKQIFVDRNGNKVGNMSLGVPALPGGLAEFAYFDAGDRYVLINIKKLPAATQGMFEGTISGIIPHAIKDKVTGQASDPYNATINVVTRGGNEITMDANELKVEVDTREVISKAYKTGGYVYEEWPKSWPESLRPDNADNYVYADWSAYGQPSGNQPFSVGFTEIVEQEGWSKDAKILAIRRNSDMKMFTDLKQRTENGVTSTTIEKFFPNNGESGYTGPYDGFNAKIYVAYPKSNFYNGDTPKQKYFDIKNTIKYTLTSIDDKEVTSKEDSAVLRFEPPVAYYPRGHFIVNKKPSGTYPVHLNMLKGFGDDIAPTNATKIRYEVNPVAFGMPWTASDSTASLTPWKQHDGEVVDLDKFNQEPYEITVRDFRTEFNSENRELTKDDFEFTSISFSKPTMYSYGKFEKDGQGYIEDSSGNIASATIRQGQYGYYVDSSLDAPELKVLATTDGEKTYEEVGRVSFVNGISISAQNGANAEGSILNLPEGTTDYKVVASTKAAAIDFSFYPELEVKPSAFINGHIQELFKNSETPVAPVTNFVDMNVKVKQGNMFINKDSATDKLEGFAYGASTRKYMTYKNEPDKRNVKLHYKAVTTIENNLNDLETLQKVIGLGYFKEQKSATWYDLLPKGVEIDTSTIGVRPGDKITNIDIQRNYKNSGQTLVKIDVEMSPQYSGTTDSPTIEFDANYSWENISDIGNTLKNHIVYESGNSILGNMKGLKGEKDDPRGNENRYTSEAITDEKTKDILTDLNPKRDDAAFLYASSQNNVTVDRYALTSLYKHVSTDQKGIYTDGLDEFEPGNVYENQTYTYRLRIKNPDNVKADNIVLYDNLEAYVPASDKQDYGDVQWKGKLLDVDVSQLESKGIKPVVYYSNKKGLVLDNTDDRSDNDLSNKEIWTTEKPDKVTAVAIDARKMKDGSDFVLGSLESLTAILTMRAPDLKREGYVKTDNEKDDWYDKTREIESVNRKVIKVPNTDFEYVYTTNIFESEAGMAGGAHAYNNAVTILNTMSAKDTSKKEELLIRHDYTKVGLKPFNIAIEKSFNDDNDRDGIRPDTVKINLVGNDKIVKSVDLSDKNKWSHEFRNMLFADEDGNEIKYKFTEEGSPGYELKTIGISMDKDVKNIKLENYHEPEKVKVKVDKKWEDVVEYPKSITYILKADGEEIKRKEVTPKGDDWSYEFTDLYKYRDGGQEIKYTVDEVDMEDFIKTVDKNTITNKYYPYGSIKISKQVTNGNQKAIDNNEFTYTLNIEATNKDEEKRVVGDYKSTKFDASGREIENKLVTDGTKFTLKHGEYLVIKDIDSRFTYKVTEDDLSYFTPNQKEITGSVIPSETNKPTDLAFINDYKTEGEVRLNAKKDLDGRKLRNRQFRFNVYDEAGKIVSVGYNDADGNVSFNPIKFNRDDLGMNGGILNDKAVKEFTIKEVKADKDGYTYDEKTVTTKVTLTDNGKGKITTDVKYKSDKILDFTPNTFTYDNKYRAKGDVEIKAWKFVKHNKDDDYSGYTFKLNLLNVLDTKTKEKFDETGIDKNRINYSSNKAFNALTATSDKEGNVVFNKIPFNQYDIGKTFVFEVKEEVKKDDKTMTYDVNSIKYYISVYDNGDGTLSFESKYTFVPDKDVKLEDYRSWALEMINAFDKDNEDIIEEIKSAKDKDQIAKIINDNKNNYPLFTNKFNPGSLVVKKTVSEGSKDEYFKFKLKLTNKDGDIPTGDYNLKRDYPAYDGMEFLGEVEGNDLITYDKLFEDLGGKSKFPNAQNITIPDKGYEEIYSKWVDEMGSDGKADGIDDKGGIWLKFRDTICTRDGEPRTFYVMKKPAKNYVSWDHIYNAGAVYGWDSLEQDPNTGAWKLKDDKKISDSKYENKIYTPKVITLNGEDYIVRLLRGRSNYNGNVRVDRWEDAQKSEWNRSIVAVTKQYRGESSSMESELKLGNNSYKYVDKDYKNQTAEYNWFGDLTVGSYSNWKYDSEDESGNRQTKEYVGYSGRGQWNWTQEQSVSGSGRAGRGGGNTDYGAANSGNSNSYNASGYYGLRLVLEPLATDN